MSELKQRILKLERDIFECIITIPQRIFYVIFIVGQLMLLLSVAWAALIISVCFMYSVLQLVFNLPDINLNEIWIEVPLGMFVLSGPLIIIGEFFHKVLDEGTIE